MPTGTGISWDLTTPTDSSNASAVDDQIRSDVTAIQTGLQEIVYWKDGSANSDGEFKNATFRLASVTTAKDPRLATNDTGWFILSQPSPHAEGGVVFERGGLYYAGGTTAEAVGHAAMQEHSPLPTTLDSRWVVQTGSFTQSATSTAGKAMENSVTFPTEYDNDDVRVFLSVAPNPACLNLNPASSGVTDIWSYGVGEVTAAGFNSQVSWGAQSAFYGGSGEAEITVYWLSEGTVTYG